MRETHWVLCEAACGADTDKRRALLAREDENSKDWKRCSSIFADKAFWVMGDSRIDSTVMALYVDTLELLAYPNCLFKMAVLCRAKTR